MLAPAGFGQTVDGDIKSLASILYTVLDRSLPAAEGAEQAFALGSGIGETVLHLDDGRATQRVQAENRIRSFERQPIDGDIGNQIPIERIAEGLVEPHAIGENGEALGVARKRRSLKPAVEQAGLKRIVLRVGKGNSRYAQIQRVDRARSPKAVQIPAVAY